MVFTTGDVSKTATRNNQILTCNKNRSETEMTFDLTELYQRMSQAYQGVLNGT